MLTGGEALVRLITASKLLGIGRDGDEIFEAEIEPALDDVSIIDRNHIVL